jgi:hypothetical protein
MASAAGELQENRHPLLDLVVEAFVIVAGWTFHRWNGSHPMLAILLLMQLGVDAGRLLFPSINKC